MLTAIGAWLTGVVTKDVLAWLQTFITGLIKAYQAKVAEQKAQEAQAAQDSHAAENLNENSSAKDVDNAVDDELSHV